MVRIGLLSFFFLCFLLSIYLLNKPNGTNVATAASKLIFVRAHVSEILSENASPDGWTEGLRLGTQEIRVIIDSGAYKNTELPAVNYLNAYANIDLKEGMPIIVRLDIDDHNMPYIASIANYNRGRTLTLLAVIFILFLIVLGGKKGISAVLGLIFTLFSIWFLLIPLLQRGFPVIPSTIALAAMTTIVSLYLLNGMSKKTLIATLGCIGGVTIAGIFASIASLLTPINGFNMMAAEELILRASDDGLNISGLLTSGIIIASLGAVMDVALTITSAVSELHAMNRKASRKALFKSGLNIGQDAMGTMANTLILAFSGASLNTLILFRAYGYPYLQIFNSDMMAIEIIQGLSGSIGIVLTVPFVAALSAFVYSSVSES